MKRSVFTLILTAALIKVNAQAPDTRLDSFYTTLANEGRLNGNVLVSEKGQIVYQHSFGYADFENKRLNTPETAFQLASLSKPFTAIAVLQLADKEKLNLDENVSRYLPSFPYPTMTISQLLSHSSGLSDQELGRSLADYEKQLGHRHNNAELLQFLAERKLKAKLSPGEKWWYCNLGYEVLADLVEKVSGETFGEYIRKNITVPAGMKHTYLLLLPGDRQSYQARNYDYPKRYSAERQRVDQTGMDYTERAFGHSNIVSTCQDLFKLSEAFFAGKLVQPTTVKRALTGTSLANGQPNAVWLNIGGLGTTVDGLGWFIFTGEAMKDQVFHAGGMSGAVTILLHDIKKQQTVIILDNTGSEAIYKNAQNGLRILNDQPVQYTKRNLARLYVRRLMAGGTDAAASLLLANEADTAHFLLPESDMNSLGYALLEDQYRVQALEVFKMNCLLFPGSDNAFNSYAEALEQSGQVKLAEEMYDRSVQLNRANEGSQKALKRLRSGR
ncbi:serine hydrolase domain-containing protein [Chitinophaga sp. S165]|uniref:serine hydrolase domain-containing protein n=1 Tax=Chitinophaga sp. S165 TaxID=2135462 RepID=UPI000D713AE0|nr:serine hydrolase domain-containing protein [Chitinophaga sp. S165]PWV54329.1 CubicO group peptidase (beta-lactamase class C family) [Chitinophaga sp. S165]